jgi:hypothetical protein
MGARYRVVKRMTIIGAVVVAFCLIDGLVLFLTNGLGSDAGPLFPWLGGVFTKNRSSGTGLLVIGALGVVVLAVGWFSYGRRLRADYRAELDEGPGAEAGSVERGR